MANWLTRGISRVNNAVRTGLNRAIGRGQPPPSPPQEIRLPPTYIRGEPEPPPRRPFIPLGGQMAPTPADYGEQFEEPSYTQEALPLPEADQAFEITLHDDYFQAVETDRLMTLDEWMYEASHMKGEDLYEKYGIDNLDIIRQLIDQGYDYKYWDYNDKGELREYSGLWRDWREAYAAAFAAA